MAVIHGIQPSFAGGEFAPSLWARVDLQKYATGTKTLKNFIVHPHGGASSRAGMKYIATTKDSTKQARLVPFEFSSVQAYVIEFGNLYCRFYMDGGQIISGGVPYEIVTPYLEADLPDLKFAQSADVLYICHPDHAPQTLTRLSHTSWTLAAYDYSGGPFQLSNLGTTTLAISNAAVGTGRTLTASASFFSSSMVGALFQLRHNVPGGSIAQAFTATGTSASIKCGDTWRILTHGTWTAKFKIEQSIDGGSNWTELRNFSGTNDFNANTFGEVDGNSLIRINCYSYTSGTLNIDLTSDPYDQAGIAKVTAYTDTTHVTASVITEIGGTTAVTDWAEGSWSPLRGYPACCTFYGDRLCFASTDTEPQTMWFTETGNYVVAMPEATRLSILMGLPFRCRLES
jgi:hypothetical protein